MKDKQELLLLLLFSSKHNFNSLFPDISPLDLQILLACYLAKTTVSLTWLKTFLGVSSTKIETSFKLLMELGFIYDRYPTLSYSKKEIMLTNKAKIAVNKMLGEIAGFKDIHEIKMRVSKLFLV